MPHQTLFYWLQDFGRKLALMAFQMMSQFGKRGLKFGGYFVFIAALFPNHSYGVVVDKFSDDSKIVVVGGALTEIVYALGEQARLIGRDTTSTFPKEAEKIPDIGYMRALSAEGILSLNPQGILLVEGSGPPTTLDVLNKVSVPMVVVKDQHDEQSVIEKIRVVGHALNRDKAAADLIEKVSQQFAVVQNNRTKIKQKKTVLFVLSLQNGRIMAAGYETAAAGMINIVGGENAMAGYSGYKIINDEAIINANPDVIWLMDNAGTSVGEEELLQNPAIKLTKAGKNHAVVRMDGLYLLGFGPRTAEAAFELSQSLYGDVQR